MYGLLKEHAYGQYCPEFFGKQCFWREDLWCSGAYEQEEQGAKTHENLT